MAQWFEDLTKTFGDEKMGRRTAMRRMAGTVAGAAFALPRARPFLFGAGVRVGFLLVIGISATSLSGRK